MWMTRVSINNPVFATMVMVALCVLGMFAYNKLGVEQMPDSNFPGAFIDSEYDKWGRVVKQTGARVN